MRSVHCSTGMPGTQPVRRTYAVCVKAQIQTARATQATTERQFHLTKLIGVTALNRDRRFDQRVRLVILQFEIAVLEREDVFAFRIDPHFWRGVRRAREL